MVKLNLKCFFNEIADGKTGNYSKLTSSERACIKVLVVLGILNIKKNKIKLSGPEAASFLRSLGEFADKDIPLISGWYGKTQKESLLDDGHSFLRQAESKRYKQGSKVPIHKVYVSVLAIKAEVKGTKEPLYLVQYNSKTNFFQLIGGYVNHEIPEEKEVRRFLKKELALNKFSKNDIVIKRIFHEVEDLRLSTKTGMITGYRINFFQVKFAKKEILRLSELDNWVQLDELFSGSTKEGVAVLTPFSNRKELKSLYKILDQLPVSVQQVQPLHTNKIVKASKARSAKKESLLTKLLRSEESSRLEFKSSARWDYRAGELNRGLQNSILKTVAGFMNSGGGRLLIGVDDDKKILGILNDINTLKKNNLDGYLQFLASLFTDNMGKEVMVYIKIRFETIEDRPVCIVEVHPSSGPVFIRNGEDRQFYVRAANTTRLLNSEETYKYIVSKKSSK